MKIDILTVLPEMVAGALEHSIVKRARERGLITINVINLRDFTFDRHKTTDDLPYGGGGDMILKIEADCPRIGVFRRQPTLLNRQVH